MGRIVSNFFISMDGVVERPDLWHFPYFDEEMGGIVGAGMASTKGILMGKKLYGEWSEYWPAQGDEDFGAVINPMPKYVLSHSEFDPTWHNTTVITGADDAAVAAQVRDLKDRTTDGDITMSGSATTVRWLIAQGLLDELALLVHPVAVAQGQRLFEDTGQVPLQLLESRALASGVMLVRYAPAKA